MKRIVFLATFVFVALALISINQAAFGQSSAIYLSKVETGYGISTDTVGSGRKIVWTMAMRNNSGQTLIGHTNGFRIYSPSGVSWTPPVIDTLDIFLTTGSGWGTRMDGGIFYEHFTTGSAADTVAIGSFAIWGQGIENGFDADAFTITIPLPGIDSIFDGGTICIDSSFYGVINNWLWATEFDLVYPDWSGPHCYTIVSTGNNAPTITSCVASLDYDHCPLAEYQFFAIDPENDTPIVYTLVSGPGSIDSATGYWSYHPSIADVGAAISIEVVANDPTGSNLSEYPCNIALIFTNYAPTLTVGCNSTLTISNGSTAILDFDADGGDCDPLSYFVSSVSPAPFGSYSINSSTGLLTFNSDAVNDSGNTYSFTIGVTDNIVIAYCSAQINVSCCTGNSGDLNNDGTDANILDLTYIIDFIFRGGLPSFCDDETDLNGDGSNANILDLTYLVDYIFRGGPAPNSC